MKTSIKAISLSAAMLTSSALLTNHASATEVTLSGNAGILSDYIFRGIPQDTGVGNGGLDLTAGGFYLGTWIADVGTGVEYDLYAGYVHEFTNGFYLGAGGTTYQYSDNFDSEYNEVNFYAGWSNELWSLDLEYTTGEYNGNFLNGNGSVEGDEYDFMGVTAGYNGVYLTYGVFGEDSDDAFGEYFELGYGFEVAGFDLTAAVVHTDLEDDPSGLISDRPSFGSPSDGDETEVYVGIHRSFDIMSWGG